MMYADDHQLYVTGNDIVEIQITLTDEGKVTTKQYYSNQLQGNPKKYHSLCIGSKNDMELIVKVMNTNNVKQSKVIKLLGVEIDSFGLQRPYKIGL